MDRELLEQLFRYPPCDNDLSRYAIETPPSGVPVKLRGRYLLLLLAGGLSAPVVCAAWTLADFVAAADQGRCIEDVVYQRISSAHGGGAAALVQAAVEALDERGEQQQQLGCDGDIAAQAIAAGADPAIVLETMAASL